jgi:hypothetical protein
LLVALSIENFSFFSYGLILSIVVSIISPLDNSILKLLLFISFNIPVCPVLAFNTHLTRIGLIN